MPHPFHHSLSSAKKWGGTVADYQRIHDWFDASKQIIADFRHRALRHHAEGILPSRPGDFHPEALTDPCMTVSRHTARAIQ